MKKGQRQANTVAEREGVAADLPQQMPDDVPLTTAQEAWALAQQQADIYRKARQKLDGDLTALAERERGLSAREQQLDESREALQAGEGAVEAARQELDQDRLHLVEAEGDLRDRRAVLDSREKELNRQALEIEKGRLDAEAGFLEQERVHLRRLAEERQRLLADVEIERQRLFSDVERRRSEHEEERERHTAELERSRNDVREELERQRAEMAAREKELRERDRHLRAAAEIQEEDREHLRQQARLAVAGELKTVQLDLETLRREHDVVMQHGLDLERQLRERDDALREVGHEGLEARDGAVRRLNAENERLLQKIATMPSAADVELLQRLKQEHEQCEVIRAELEMDRARLRSENHSFTIANNEVEELREHRDVLWHRVNLHQQLLNDAQTELDKLVSNAHAPRPFPGLQELDETPALQRVCDASDKPLHLTELVREVQQRILADRRHRRGPIPLAYSERDIRCLLGGLAMSRLHILQGISGIGKTTFPKAFAAAIGAEYEVIEVQAGWRDRQDLVGHLNAFERKYYETAFTKAVYQAGCAAHLNRPFFIILDEMNLAHPEQYFADVLSGLENAGSQFRLQLATHTIEPTADLLVVDKGVHLPVPDNVWFFGTANQDETTVKFADKTYDRAHIIELPSTPPTLTAQKYPPRSAISRRALLDSFHKAWRDHSADAKMAVDFLRKHLAGVLANDFNLGWGPRLEKQIGDFTPVVVAAGGSPGEATDHILSTRILRKLEGRYNLQPEKLLELRGLIDDRWSELAKVEISESNGPVATRALLDALIEERS